MNDITSARGRRKRREAPAAQKECDSPSRPQAGGLPHRSPRSVAVRSATVAIVTAIAVASLSGGCARQAGPNPGCAHRLESLPASPSFGLIVSIPRISAESASWALRELSILLPIVARAGLDLHVIYTQDGDDLGAAGGDGRPPQILLTHAPTFSALRVHGRPEPPADPTALSAKLYCGRLGSWERRESRLLRAAAAQRNGSVAIWRRTTVAKLTALAGRPIPDTSGSEAGTEIDANLSIFAVVQVAQAAPRSTILLLGDLPDLRPPSMRFRFATRVVALIRSGPPRRILRVEAAWRRWTRRSGGSFIALSANDDPRAIARALDEPGG